MAAMVEVGGVGVGPDAAAPRLVVKSCIGGLVLVSLVCIAKFVLGFFTLNNGDGLTHCVE